MLYGEKKLTNFFAGSTTAKLSPQEQIAASNEIIKQQGEVIAKATENINSATSATNLVGEINTQLSTRKIIFNIRRIKRQILTCTQFETKFGELLELLLVLSDNVIDELSGAVNELKNVNINDLCNAAEKTNLKQKTESKVSDAVAKGSQFVNDQNEKIAESKAIIEDAEEKITESNEILVSSGISTIPAATTPVIPTTIAQGKLYILI